MQSHNATGDKPPERPTYRIQRDSGIVSLPVRAFGLSFLYPGETPEVMPATKEEIRLSNRTDRWRFMCPNGHRSWEPTNNHFWCQQCARSYDDDVEPEFDVLHDLKTEEEIHRDELVLRQGNTLEIRGEA